MRTVHLIVIVLAIALGGVGPNAAYADSFQQTVDVFKESPVVRPFFESAYGYAVFPLIGKGGFIVGGAYGNGRVYAQGTATGTSRVIEVSIGLQAGGQAFSQIIFFEDRRAFDEFTSGSFEFDAGLSAVAVTAGLQAKAGTEGLTAGASAGPATGIHAQTSYYKGMAVFVHATGGLMFEASVGGQQFSYTPY